MSVSALLSLQMNVPATEKAIASFQQLAFKLENASPTAETGVLQIGSVQVHMAFSNTPPFGLSSWTFQGDEDTSIRLDPSVAPPTFTQITPPPTVSASHPNGVTGIDHVVVVVPSLDALVAGMESFVKVPCKRRTEVRGLPAAFFRAGETILEVVEMRGQQPPRIWGLAFSTPNLDATIRAVHTHGGKISKAKPSLQGGRISASPFDGGADISVAFIEPPPAKKT